MVGFREIETPQFRQAFSEPDIVAKSRVCLIRETDVEAPDSLDRLRFCINPPDIAKQQLWSTHTGAVNLWSAPCVGAPFRARWASSSHSDHSLPKTGGLLQLWHIDPSSQFVHSVSA